MLTIDCVQNSEQWQAARRGLPTASEFHRIVCAEMSTGYRCPACQTTYSRERKSCGECRGDLEPYQFVKRSAQADGYIYQLIAESLGFVEERQPNHWMDRGHELEPAAVTDYEFLTGNDTEKVGFCVTDDGLLGASPDRQIVGKRRWLEAKCPSPAVHIRHLVTGDLEDNHKIQLQGQLLVTGYEGVDIISHCPSFPSIVIQVERDEEFISGMNDILVDFVTRLHRTRAELIAKYGDFKRKFPAPDPLGFNLTDADAHEIYEESRK